MLFGLYSGLMYLIAIAYPRIQSTVCFLILGTECSWKYKISHRNQCTLLVLDCKLLYGKLLILTFVFHGVYQ